MGSDTWLNPWDEEASLTKYACPGLKPVRVTILLRFVTTQVFLTVLWMHLVSRHVAVVFDHICTVYEISVTRTGWNFIVMVSRPLEINCGLAKKYKWNHKKINSTPWLVVTRRKQQRTICRSSTYIYWWKKFKLPNAKFTFFNIRTPTYLPY